MFKALIRVLIKKRVWIPLLLVIVGVLIWWGYQGLWTGFKGQSLWHWMQLLIIPIVLGAGALWFRREESIVERETARDKQHQDTLVTYFDKMENLLLNHGLRKPKKGSEVRSVARVRTLSVFRNLDEQRKRYALQFLYESDLVNRKNPVVNLEWDNLWMANLRAATLEGLT